MSTLVDAVARVQRLRETRDELKATLSARIVEFEATIQPDATLCKKWNDELEAAEKEAKALALVAYEADPANKQPAPGVTIKVMIERTYDAAKAFAWAKEKQLCLTPEALDEKAFVKIASVQKFDFVTTNEVPQAQLASDLKKVIAQEALV